MRTWRRETARWQAPQLETDLTLVKVLLSFETILQVCGFDAGCCELWSSTIAQDTLSIYRAWDCTDLYAMMHRTAAKDSPVGGRREVGQRLTSSRSIWDRVRKRTAMLPVRIKCSERKLACNQFVLQLWRSPFFSWWIIKDNTSILLYQCILYKQEIRKQLMATKVLHKNSLSSVLYNNILCRWKFGRLHEWLLMVTIVSSKVTIAWTDYDKILHQ